MKRRKFLAGASGVGLGGSGLIGSGAFSAVESQRQVTIQLAEDTDAYLGLDTCGTINGDNFVGTDGQGHLTVDISEHSDAADAGRDVSEPAEGVNSDSLTAFDNVFRICNQGKEDACVWIDAEVAEDLLEGHDTSLPTLDFYVLDGDGDPRSILGEENSVKLPVGECFCVGIRVYSRFLSAGDQIVENEEIRIIADVDGADDCPEVNGGTIPPGEEPQNGQGISFIAFCGDDLTANDYTLSIVGRNEDGEPTSVSWSGPTPDNIVVFGGARLFNTSGSPITLSGDEVEWKAGNNPTEQRPPSPCKDGNCGPKFDYKSASDTFEAVGHQDQCVDESDD
ncbi:hypothetical protein [Halorubrum sp. DTA46]|uniref:hypothetical protein n=1 Tax=Halorubrum sp. DTA46 TaxID=3402162 RepID=UPI003AAE8CC0